MGGDFVSLSWAKPSSDGGGRIQGYIVERKEAGSDNWMRVNHVPTPATIFNIPSLIEDREYEFRVFAVNEAGESKPSTASRKVKVKDPNGECQGQGHLGFKVIWGSRSFGVQGHLGFKVIWGSRSFGVQDHLMFKVIWGSGSYEG